jgi:hypothetical protein
MSGNAQVLPVVDKRPKWRVPGDRIEIIPLNLPFSKGEIPPLSFPCPANSLSVIIPPLRGKYEAKP